MAISTAAPANADGEESAAAVTSKQRELLNACNLHLRVLDPAFLDTVGQDRKPALVRALEVDASCGQTDIYKGCSLHALSIFVLHACYTLLLLHTSSYSLPSTMFPVFGLSY